MQTAERVLLEMDGAWSQALRDNKLTDASNLELALACIGPFLV